MWELGPSFLREGRTVGCTLAPSCLVACRKRNATTMSGIGNFLRLSSPWKSGATGFRGLNTLSRFSQTTRTLSTCSRLSDSILAKLVGPYFLIVFSSFSPTGPALRTSNRMPCPKLTLLSHKRSH